MSRKFKIIIVLQILFIQSSIGFSEVKLPRIIGSNMVLQQEKPIRIWGWADPGETVTVKIAHKKTKVKADEGGNWKVTLAAMKASGPHTMTIAGENTIELTNILVGEVWICSGQSNMVRPLRSVTNNVEEIVAANYQQMRLFQVPRKAIKSPEDDVDAEWKICDPRSTIDFSAVAYFFGRKLHNELGVPIGLINTSWGGTRIEPWTPPEGFQAVPELHHIAAKIDSNKFAYRENLQRWLNETETWFSNAKKAFAKGNEIPAMPQLDKSGIEDRQKRTWLYNGMVHPLVSFAIRGAIWYQGESNRHDGLDYFDKMKALILGWR